jgi:phosphonate transport system substrate-binding protein
MKLGKQLFILTTTLSVLSFGSAQRYPAGADDRFLFFGRVHDDPVRSIRDRQEFVDYLAKNLAAFGITGGRIVVVDKLHLLADALKTGTVDLFHDSVVPTMVLSRLTGSVPILRQWKNREAEYEGVIVVKKNSSINSLADLKGKVIAFEEPHSTSATILPRMLLEENKLKLMEVKAPGKVKPDAVGFMYGSDGNSANFLVTGRTDAATITLREIERLKPEVRDNLKIIGKTKPVPRQIVSVRKDLDPKLVKALKEVLLKMDSGPEGQGVLNRQQKTTKFDEMPAGSLQQLKYIESYVFSSMGKELSSW